MRRVLLLLSVALAAAGLAAGAATANTSHDGWPKIDGVLLMNKTDSRRPLDARPGHDPFRGRDPPRPPPLRRPRPPLLLRRDPQAGQVSPALRAPPRRARPRHDWAPRT